MGATQSEGGRLEVEGLINLKASRIIWMALTVVSVIAEVVSLNSLLTRVYPMI
jgi:hypothetical protein